MEAGCLGGMASLGEAGTRPGQGQASTRKGEAGLGQAGLKTGQAGLARSLLFLGPSRAAPFFLNFPISKTSISRGALNLPHSPPPHGTSPLPKTFQI